jgi:diguanylate cyclase (GGDEF)-like protein
VGVFRGSSGVVRLAFALFAGVALILVFVSLALLIAGPGDRWPVAVVGVLAAAVLEISWLRVGSVPHRSPVISVPSLALPVLAAVLPLETAIGLVVLGVLLGLLWESRRASVALYSAGLVGSASLVSVLLFLGLRQVGAPESLAVAGGAVAYVASVIGVELLRRRFSKPPVDLGGRPSLSALRVTVVMLVTVVLAVVGALWSAEGVPFLARQNPARTAGAVLLLLVLAAAWVKAETAVVVMRRRLAGLVAAASALSANHTAPGQTDAAADVPEVLCRAVADTIGVESVELRETPAGPGQISMPVTLSAGSTSYVVATRDAMDGSFTRNDRSSLEALALTAETVVQARRNIAGLARRANIDPLTGLPNYGAFQEALANINDHRNYSEALAVLFIDLDDFKRLNDRFGHQAGDDVLSELGRRLTAVVRPHDVVARVGGDEFVVILTELSSLGEANTIAERIMFASGQPLTIGPNTYNPVLSIGLAYSAHRETDVNQLVQDADRSMLAIKKSRRRGGPSKESSINISSHRSSEMNDIVARAIDEDLLQMAFQPIVSLVTGQIWAFEALVRYTHPELGPISPSSLVEKAKGLGRLDKLTRQVALKAMAAAAEFRLIEPRVVCMTINVEAGQILPKRVGSFVEELAELYPGITLCLELNERSMARVTPAVRAQAEHLRDIGLMIALDDYGSQDSSVDALVRMPMDILKIDRSLVDDLDDVRQREVLTALQGFGDNLEYSMIVEGVENEMMAAHLNALGIRSAQGFHYGIPQSLEATLARLEEFGARAVLPPGVASATGTLRIVGAGR